MGASLATNTSILPLDLNEIILQSSDKLLRNLTVILLSYVYINFFFYQRKADITVQQQKVSNACDSVLQPVKGNMYVKNYIGA